MNTAMIVKQIDEEVAKLNRAKALLGGAASDTAKVSHHARHLPASITAHNSGTRRKMSRAARERISVAMKQRWATLRSAKAA